MAIHALTMAGLAFDVAAGQVSYHGVPVGIPVSLTDPDH
jgi:hypothetical protein